VRAARPRTAAAAAGGSPLLDSIGGVHEGRPHRVKDREKALLYHAVCAGGSPTRQALARRLSLRPSSVSEAVQELVDDGLVEESPARRGPGSGRPCTLLAPRHRRFTAISLFVDARELRAVLVTPAEEVLAEEACAVDAEAGNAQMAAAILGLLRRVSASAPAGQECVGAAVSLVGTVNERTRTWVSAARWPRLSALDLAVVERKWGLPLLVRRANDVELAYHLERAPEARVGNVLLLHWGFGIGSAAAHDGGLLGSTIGRFGEIGHTRAAAAGETPCLCGRRGCVETVAALWALLPRLRKRFGDLPEDEKDLAPRLADPRILALPETRRALEAVRGALETLCMVFYPDAVLLSGPFTENPTVSDGFSVGLRAALPEYAPDAMRIISLPGGMQGCRRGGAYPLFRQALARALRRKT
jgi:predicted NBD/HSP70 family sugar kinase